MFLSMNHRIRKTLFVRVTVSNGIGREGIGRIRVLAEASIDAGRLFDDFAKVVEFFEWFA